MDMSARNVVDGGYNPVEAGRLSAIGEIERIKQELFGALNQQSSLDVHEFAKLSRPRQCAQIDAEYLKLKAADKIANMPWMDQTLHLAAEKIDNMRALPESLDHLDLSVDFIPTTSNDAMLGIDGLFVVRLGNQNLFFTAKWEAHKPRQWDTANLVLHGKELHTNTIANMIADATCIMQKSFTADNPSKKMIAVAPAKTFMPPLEKRAAARHAAWEETRGPTREEVSQYVVGEA